MTTDSKRALIPVDAGDLPLAAFEAIELLVGRDDNHFLVVLPSSEQTHPLFNWGTVDGESREDHARRVMVHQLSTTRFANAEVHVGFGHAATVVLEHAERLPIDVIVIPCLTSHRSKSMNAAVAEAVKATANHPVMAVEVPCLPHEAIEPEAV